MAAPVAVTIGGVPITTVDQASFRIESILGQTVDTAQLQIFDKNANIAIPEQVDVIITRTDTGERIFGGLSSIVDGWTQGVSRWWQVQCQDYTILLDTTLVFNSYPSGFTYDGLIGDKAVIAHLFEKSIVGATGGTGPASEIEARTYVQQGLSSMAAIYFYYTSLREALNTIANYSGWNFYIDYNKHLHYYFRESIAAPFALSSSPDNVTSIGYRNLKWRRDGTSVRNMYVQFGTSLFSSTQTFIIPSDGAKTHLTIGIADIGRNVVLAAIPAEKYIEVYKNTGTDIAPVWTALTVGIDGVDSLASVDVLHNAIHQTLDFAVAPPNLTNSVKVMGVYQINAGQQDVDGGSIAKYGRAFAKRLVASDANSAAALAGKLATYKKEFAYAIQKITLQVDDGAFPVGNTLRFKVGQWVYFTNAVLGITNKGYLIHRVTTTILGGELKSYELELRNYFTDTAV